MNLVLQCLTVYLGHFYLVAGMDGPLENKYLEGVA